MLVQTYECEETAQESCEETEEATRLMLELGMEARAGGSEAKRNPYRHMTADEAFVFRTLCPQRTKLAEYRNGPIPLRVLQVAAHASTIKEFHGLSIWSAESAAVKDPVLVGLSGLSYDPQFWILARWGDVLDEWPALVKAAMAKWRESMKSKISNAIKSAELDLAAIDAAGLNVAVRTRIVGYDGLKLDE